MSHVWPEIIRPNDNDLNCLAHKGYFYAMSLQPDTNPSVGMVSNPDIRSRSDTNPSVGMVSNPVRRSRSDTNPSIGMVSNPVRRSQSRRSSKVSFETNTDDLDDLESEGTSFDETAFQREKTMIDLRAKSIADIQPYESKKLLSECQPQIVAAFDIPAFEGGEKSRYTSVAYVSDTQVVLADANNKGCYLYTLRGEGPVAEIKFSSCPFSVISLDQQRIAVSLPEERIIQILEVTDGQFVPLRDILTRWCCYGLGVLDNGRLIVFYDFPSLGAFGIFDELDGRELSYVEISAEKLLSSRELETNMNYFGRNEEKFIGVDKTRNMFISIIKRDVSNVRKSYLIGVYPDKHIAFTCRWRGDQGCVGIGVDRSGNVYVFYRNVIDRLSPAGEELGAFRCPSVGAGTMEAMGFHPNGEEFIVITRLPESQRSPQEKRKALIVKIQ
ncbi:hypothetical protein CHS0354_023598 [Potamilus streckersoni]|uniref:Uncharacterized protein n=1 Tax=Potamilus streckersoni TaxID=2493646 RepID=A0AAE0VZ37_9BIVA|nr:hypothetical protein CHS0354_023598 [Potamilus streckersoni]